MDVSDLGRALAAQRKRARHRCPICGQRFEGLAHRKFCSDACRVKAWRAEHTTEGDATVKTARIILFDHQGHPQSSGTVAVRSNGLSYGEWLMGGEHVSRRPLGLIRRIARNWYDDGADRAYEGWDEKAETAFSIQPA